MLIRVEDKRYCEERIHYFNEQSKRHKAQWANVLYVALYCAKKWNRKLRVSKIADTWCIELD